MAWIECRLKTSIYESVFWCSYVLAAVLGPPSLSRNVANKHCSCLMAVSVSVFPWWHRHIQSLQYMFIALINIIRHQMLSKCTSKSPPLPLHLFCQEFKLITSCLLTPLLSFYWLELISKLTWLDFNHIYDKLQEVIQNLGSVSEVSIINLNIAYGFCYMSCVSFVLMPQIPDQRTCTCPPYIVDLLLVIFIFIYFLISFYTDNTWQCNLQYLLQNLPHSWPFSLKLFYYFSKVNS